MKTKILSKLPSINALLTRMHIIIGKIEVCEGEIPEEFWCDNCKRLLQKIESLEQKIEDAELEALKSETYEEMNKAESRVDQGRVDHYGSSLYQAYSQPTPTYKYKCLHCGRFFVNDKHLWPPLGTYISPGEEIRCSSCDGIVEEIKPGNKTQ